VGGVTNNNKINNHTANEISIVNASDHQTQQHNQSEGEHETETHRRETNATHTCGCSSSPSLTPSPLCRAYGLACLRCLVLSVPCVVGLMRVCVCVCVCSPRHFVSIVVTVQSSPTHTHIHTHSLTHGHDEITRTHIRLPSLLKTTCAWSVFFREFSFHVLQAVLLELSNACSSR
jgi:hypothetical protein